jgi:hypothetical protein
MIASKHVIVLASLITIVLHSQAKVLSCEQVASAFLTRPSERTFIAISGVEDEACWALINSSNAELFQVIHATARGNRWAAEYLARHMGMLDGGNLEDASRALGQFAEHEMEQLLIFSHRGLLTEHRLEKALTMLPLSLSDDPRAQLETLKRRREKVLRVRRKDLSEQRRWALEAIDAFSAEVRSNNPETNHQ